MVSGRAQTAIRAGMHQTESIPGLLTEPARAFSWRGAVLVFFVCVLAGTQAVFPSNGILTASDIISLALYIASLLTIGLVHYGGTRWMIAVGAVTALVLALVLGVGRANLLSALTFELLALVALYRLPWRWSLPITALAAVLLFVTQYRHSVLLSHAPSGASDFWKLVIPLLVIPLIAVVLRSRSLVIQRLRATQARLEEEMKRTAQLAAARERARIARDMHDVLAHSLTVLSIQAQATRAIMPEDPARAAGMLDEMVELLRQSVGESRRLVGLLREAEHAESDDSSPGARLHALMERFGARTGVQCAFEETGAAAHALDAERERALHFALQEALTNAYRHGQAGHVWATLAWSSEAVSLRVRDDGAGVEMDLPGAGGGNGLRGMRERAEALGGTVHAAPADEGGFEVRVTLPLAHAGVAKRVGDL